MLFIRLLLIGDSGVGESRPFDIFNMIKTNWELLGKTSLLLRYYDNFFDPTPKSTIGTLLKKHKHMVCECQWQVWIVKQKKFWSVGSKSNCKCVDVHALFVKMSWFNVDRYGTRPDKRDSDQWQLHFIARHKLLLWLLMLAYETLSWACRFGLLMSGRWWEHISIIMMVVFLYITAARTKAVLHIPLCQQGGLGRGGMGSYKSWMGAICCGRKPSYIRNKCLLGEEHRNYVRGSVGLRFGQQQRYTSRHWPLTRECDIEWNCCPKRAEAMSMLMHYVVSFTFGES